MFKRKVITSDQGQIYSILNEKTVNCNIEKLSVRENSEEEFVCLKILLRSCDQDVKNIKTFINSPIIEHSQKCKSTLQIINKFISGEHLYLITETYDMSIEELFLEDPSTAKKFLQDIKLAFLESHLSQNSNKNDVICLSNILIKKGAILFLSSGLGDLALTFFPTKLNHLCFRAPEYLTNRNVTAKSLIWSIGVCIFTLINGRVPFAGTSKKEIMSSMDEFKQVLHENKSESEGSSDEFAILEKMLEFEPEMRIEIDELKNCWFFKKFHNRLIRFKMKEKKDPSSFNSQMIKKTTIQNTSAFYISNLVSDKDVKYRIETNLSKTFNFFPNETLMVNSNLKDMWQNSLVSHQNNDFDHSLLINQSKPTNPLLSKYVFEKNVLLFFSETLKKLMECKKLKTDLINVEIYFVLALLVLQKGLINGYLLFESMRLKLNIFSLNDFEKIVDFHEFLDFQKQIEVICVEFKNMYSEYQHNKLVNFLDIPKNIDLTKIDLIQSTNLKIDQHLLLFTSEYNLYKSTLSEKDRIIFSQACLYCTYSRSSEQIFVAESFSNDKSLKIFCEELNKMDCEFIDKILG